MAWTEDRVAVLTKLWAEGLSASQIAKELGGVTRNAVIGKVHRLGLSGRAKPSRPKNVTPRKASPTRRKKTDKKPEKIVAKTVEDKTASEPVRVLAPLEAKPLPNGEYATVLTIRDHMCKWPIGDPAQSDFRFCGRRIKAGEPYCEAHCDVAYQPSRRRGAAPKALPGRGKTRFITRQNGGG